MTEKTANVHWEGNGNAGRGQISTENLASSNYPYGFASRFGARFGADRNGLGREEILGAAHAACFSMAFSCACEKAGFATAVVDTQAHVRLAPQGDGFVIDHIGLTLSALVPGISEIQFQKIAQAAKWDCPLSKALANVAEITLDAKLRHRHYAFPDALLPAHTWSK